MQKWSMNQIGFIVDKYNELINNNHMSQKKRYTGLTDAEVLESRRKNGVNILTPPEQDPWWKEFLDKFSDPLIIILLVAGVLSIGISFYEFFGLGQDWKVFFEPIGIFVAIGLATTHHSDSTDCGNRHPTIAF